MWRILIILLLVIVFTQFRDNPGVEAVFKGIRPAVVALIFAPLLRMGKNADMYVKSELGATDTIYHYLFRR